MRVIRTIQSGFTSSEDILLFLQILLFTTILPLLVKILSVPRLMDIITPHASKFRTIIDLGEITNKIEKYTDYLLGRNCWVYKPNCLKRSLILYHFLRKYGINVSVCFGVKYKQKVAGGTEEKQMDGHAWLLCNGAIYLEKNIQVTETYTMTYCYPGSNDNLKVNRVLTAIGGLK